MPHGRKISVVGLGYVGLPVAVAFGQHGRTVGFDIDRERIEELRGGIDRTREVAADELARSDVHYTSDPAELGSADFHIVAVPTPIDDAQQPDLAPLLSASETVGRQLKRGDIVVYESTVYPGATEEECIPVLERESGLEHGADFVVGYSPERINPGDKEHVFSRITKVVSAATREGLDVVSAVYEQVVEAGVHRASTIRVAEAAKVIENTQRDLNIALMNELAVIFDRMGIDTGEVLAAAGTKWNFLKFSPGLVGGHCIGVDPYYLTYKATREGYHPQVILAGRRINDGMGEFIAARAVKLLIQQGLAVKTARVTVLGVTFKENVPDLRNTRVVDVVRALADYGIEVQVHDPSVSPEEADRVLGLTLTPLAELEAADCVILAVAHDAFLREGWPFVSSLLRRDRQGSVIDVKGALPPTETPDNVDLWRL